MLSKLRKLLAKIKFGYRKFKNKNHKLFLIIQTIDLITTVINLPDMIEFIKAVVPFS